MFLRKPPNQNKVEYVNLRNVSYINETPESIILNMCFSYEDKKSRIISHQHFLNADDKGFMESKYFQDNFVKVVGDDRIVYANRQFIASIIAEMPVDPENNKIIICFTNGVTKDPNGRILPEYLYIRMSDGDVHKYVKELVKIIELKGLKD